MMSKGDLFMPLIDSETQLNSSTTVVAIQPKEI